jgi:hypothetical protein
MKQTERKLSFPQFDEVTLPVVLYAESLCFCEIAYGHTLAMLLPSKPLPSLFYARSTEYLTHNLPKIANISPLSLSFLLVSHPLILVLYRLLPSSLSHHDFPGTFVG